MVEGEPPILVLDIMSSEPLRGDLVAAAIQVLCAEFQNHAREHNLPDAHLRIDSLRTGSVIAKLIAIADAANKLYEAGDVVTQIREVVAGFYQQLYTAYVNVMSGNAKELLARDRETLQTLAAPVAQDCARSVTINLYGNNYGQIYLDQAFVEAASRAADDAGDNVGAGEPQMLSPPTIESTNAFPGATVVRHDEPPATRNEHRLHVAHGMLLQYGDEWMVQTTAFQRPVTLLGDFPDRRALQRGRRYFVNGSLVLTQRGEPVGFLARTSTMFRPEVNSR